MPLSDQPDGFGIRVAVFSCYVVSFARVVRKIIGRKLTSCPMARAGFSRETLQSRAARSPRCHRPRARMTAAPFWPASTSAGRMLAEIGKTGQASFLAVLERDKQPLGAPTLPSRSRARAILPTTPAGTCSSGVGALWSVRCLKASRCHSKIQHLYIALNWPSPIAMCELYWSAWSCGPHRLDVIDDCNRMYGSRGFVRY